MKRVQIRWEGENGETFFIELDAAISEQHNADNTITDFAVEKGANISDHVRPQPETISIEGRVSNTPIYLPKDHVDGAQERRQAVQGRAPNARLQLLGPLRVDIPTGPQPSGSVLAFTPEFDRVRSVDNEFMRLRAKGTRLTVDTTLRKYVDMVIESYSVQRNAQLGNTLAFTIGLKRVRFGKTETVPAPVLPRKKKDRGQKPKKELEEAQEPEQPRSSLLNNVFG